MKKLTAILLTGCFTFQMIAGSVVSVTAADFTSGSFVDEQLPTLSPEEEVIWEEGEPIEEEELPLFSSSSEDSSFEDGTTEMALQSGPKAGGIHVDLTSTYPFSEGASAKISLSSSFGDTEQTVALRTEKGAYHGNAFFEALSPGEYTLTLQTKGFGRYTQTLAVKEGCTSRVKLHSEKFKGYQEGNHPGLLLPGDVTGDYYIDGQDKDALLGALRRETGEKLYDLNGDQRVNLADLQILSHSLTQSPVFSTVESLVYAKAVEGSTGESTKLTEGSLNGLLENQSPVTLAPAGGQVISPENPVEASFVFAEEAQEAGVEMEGFTIQAPVSDQTDTSHTSNIASGVAEVYVTDEAGQEQMLSFDLITGALITARARAAAASDGTLTIHFGQKIAVKKVTIKITGTKKNESLVNISKVEFVNDMESRIPAPVLGIPSGLQGTTRSKQIDLSWKPEQNITGYEVYISGKVGKRGNAVSETELVRTAATSHSFLTIKDKNLINKEPYTVKVRSVNGDWTSQWSEVLELTPKAETAPPAPDNLKAVGGHRSVHLTWKDMDDTDSYSIYVKGPQDKSFVKVKEDLKENTYILTGLEDRALYQVYVTGVNEKGESGPSIVSEAVTIIPDFPSIPKYKLLNTSQGEGKVTAHIQEVVIGNQGGSHMVDSPLDKERTGFGLVDDSFTSHWKKEDWDDGASYRPTGDEKGITITLDRPYKMSYLSFGAADYPYTFQNSVFWYWDEEGTRRELGSRLIHKTDENQKDYYILKFNRAVTTDKLQFCLNTNGNKRLMKISEIHLHRYDSLEDEIMALYEDDMHTQLLPEVTMETIKALEERALTKEEESQEYHPLKDELLKELDVAKGILENRQEKVIAVDPAITHQKDGHLNFSGLNGWQPLGKTAYSGERLILYVGHNSRKPGDGADLKLVFAQHHAESKGFSKEWSLQVGRNELTLPNLQSISGVEKGGQLYILYTGNNPRDRYGVRVVGGQSIPALNVVGLEEQDRDTAIEEYVTQLQEHVEQLTDKHGKLHETVDNRNVNVPYDERNCILNATDILMNQMMYSLPATQIWKGLAGSSVSQKAESLKQALKAGEEAMLLAYQHKGLSNAQGAPARDRLPSRHLNIRYMRMFAGAFMYAAGNHIGIEFDQANILSSVKNIGDLGWGISHEIGHNINEPSYAIAEITNNYFAQLMTVNQRGLRFSMPKVYEKVTSGTIGRSSNLATQLALYWQLHLAYDNGEDQTIYNQYQQQFDNLFFARVDSYSRKPDRAPQSGLSLKGSADQNLMRLAVAAANKNILPFFERWGMVPDKETIAYAQKYGQPEAKALYYVNPQARDYRRAHQAEEAALTIAGKNVGTASLKADGNQVTLTIIPSGNKEVLLGYEIVRTMISNGETHKQVVGFAPCKEDGSGVYVDRVSAINNRVMTYEVRPVDCFLNYGNTLVAGSTKLQTEGRLDKAQWKTLTEQITSLNDVVLPPTEEDPDNGSAGEKVQKALDFVIDGDEKTTLQALAASGGTLTIDMGKVQEITSLKYQGEKISDLTLEISKDGSSWKEVKAHVAVPASEKAHTIWFDAVDPEAKDQWIGTYDSRYVRLLFHKEEKIAIQEIDLLGPSGDNLEFYQGETPAVGILKAPYQYGKHDTDVIPAGSLVFMGTYKGNPAFNVVLLYDGEGNVIGVNKGADGENRVDAEQVILAEVPEKGNLGETSDGTWIYYVKPQENGTISEETMAQLKGSVRGELYRVDDPLTNEGERVVSDTLPITVDSGKLPSIELTSGRPVAEQ